MKRFAILLAFLAALTATLTGCAKPITVEEILVKSAAAMEGVETVKFSLERQGEPISITLAEGIDAKLISANGEYSSGDAHAIVKAEAPLVGALEADVIWLGEKGYFKAPPLIAAYQEFTVEGFSLTTIFTGHGSIAHVLTDHLLEPTLVGEEEVEGVTTYHVQGQADSAELADLTAGSLAEGTATLDIWIDKETFQVVRIAIVEADGNGWLLDFYDYGVAVEIPQP